MSPKPSASKKPAKGAALKPAIAGTVVGPGVVKRPKRDLAAAHAPAQGDVDYTPSEQVFRRKP